MLCISNATILTPVKTISDGIVIMRDGLIEAVGRSSDLAVPEKAQVLDGTGLLLVPGFIDLQLNGAFGLDFTEKPQSIWKVAAHLPRYGVTSFLPTIITSPLSRIHEAQIVWAKGPPSDYNGSTPLGLHIEGPFLNPAKKGAHNPAYLRPPTMEHVVTWSVESGVRLVTLAPELLGALDIIATLKERGVVVAAGHSIASYEETRLGIVVGIRYATHLFNAMISLHHREPGLVGALLADERVTVGLIPDGIHVHRSLIKLIWLIAGDGRISLVTDAMAALGMPPGTYSLGDSKVTVTRKEARLADGTLAGSVLSLDRALRNLINFTGCSPADALRTVTTTPATLLGLSRRKGQIAPGFDADLVLATPDFTVVATIVAGQVAYRSESLLTNG